MSEAEKKWRKWDEVNPVFGSLSREAYKAALRREIKKRVPKKPNTFDEYVFGTRAAMKTILELLDTVEP